MKEHVEAENSFALSYQNIIPLVVAVGIPLESQVRQTRTSHEKTQNRLQTPDVEVLCSLANKGVSFLDAT